MKTDTPALLITLFGIVNLFGILKAQSACGNTGACQCMNPIQGQQFKNVVCEEGELTSLPNGIPTSVVELSLSNNKLTDVPNLKKFKNIEKLWLDGNQITSVDDDDFTSLSELKEVYLDDNPITSVAKAAFTGLGIKNLSKIVLDDIQLNCTCKEFNFAVWAKGRSIAIGTIMCLNTNPVERLDAVPANDPFFANCKRSTNDDKACSGQTPVCACAEGQVLCNNKDLDKLPIEIPLITKDLNLSANKLTTVPNDVKKLVNLESLDLSGNLITAIKRDDFKGLSKLISINLRNNKIRTVDWSAFSDLNDLKDINIENNPLQCGCKDVPYLQKLKTDSSMLSGNPTCQNVNAETHLKDVDLSKPPFDNCNAPTTVTPTTGRPTVKAVVKCMQCTKVNALTEEECDKVGKVQQCPSEKNSCKIQFKFDKSGGWTLNKLCSKYDCETISQAKPCVIPERGFKGVSGTCSTCCGGNLCNEEYAEMKGYLKTAVFKLQVDLVDAKEVNTSEIEAALQKLVADANLPGVTQPPKFKISGSQGIAELNSTFLRGYMNKTQNSIKAMMRVGVQKDPVLKKYVAPGKMEIWTTEYCPPEKLTDELKGTYSWPATRGTGTAKLECVKGNGEKALRRCVFGPSPSGELIPVWDDPNLGDCDYLSETTDKLDKLTQIPITAGTVNLVSKQLAAVSASAKNEKDVSLSTGVVDNLVKSDIAFYKENVNITTKDVVTTVSNLLNVDFNTMQGAGSARSLIANIEEMIRKIKLDAGQELGVVENNLALTVVDTTTGKADDGLQYGVTATPGYRQFNDTNVGMGKRGAKTKTSIDLPAGIFKGKGIKKAAFVGYKSDMLFKVMESESTAHQATVVGDKKFNATSNSMVLAATLDQPISGLTGDDLIDMKFEHTNKELADNPRCAWWDQASNNGNGSWSTKGCKVGATQDGVTTCSCDHLTNFALLMDVYGANEDMNASHQQALTIISITGCTLSAVALIFTIFTYAFFHRKLLKDNPSKILLNLCTALLGLNLVFLGGTHYQVDDGACKAVAVLLHYFLLAGFTWMGVEAFYMYLALVKVFQPYFSKLILKCCLVGWGVPLVIVVITIGVNKTDNYYLKGGQICWIRDIPFYGAIVAPVCLILILNIIAFILVVRQLRRLTLRKKLTKQDTAHTSTVTQLRGSISVLVLLGLTWLFAFLSIGDASLAFAYIFAILNTLQGLWIFIFYCLLKKDVQHAWMRQLICCPTPEDSRSSKGKYTLNHQNTSKNSKGSQGSRKTSDSNSGVTYIATYKRVSTGTSTTTNSTRLSSANSTKSKKSVTSTTTVMTDISIENDVADKPTDDNCNSTSYENPAYSRSVSDSTAGDPIPKEATAEPGTEEQPGPTEELKEDTGEKNYKWEVKTPTGFVDSRGFVRPTHDKK